MDILIFTAVILLASYFQGIAGFGQGLIAAPIAFVLFNKSTALSALIISLIILNGYLVTVVKTRLHFRTLCLLLAGSVLGLPIGLMIARSVSLPALQLAVGCIAIVSASTLLFYKVRLRKRSIYSIIAGFLSGILQTSTGLSGPPVILLLAEENMPKQTMRKLLPAYFFIMGTAAAVLFVPAGLININGIIVALIAAPLAIYGGHAGSKQSRKIHQKSYRVLIMVTILTTGLLAVYEGITHYV